MKVMFATLVPLSLQQRLRRIGIRWCRVLVTWNQGIRRITAYAKSRARYTVQANDGRLPADRMSTTELRMRYSALCRINGVMAVAWVGL